MQKKRKEFGQLRIKKKIMDSSGKIIIDDNGEEQLSPVSEEAISLFENFQKN